MVATIVYVLIAVVSIFWLIQVIDLLTRDVKDFESHTHKLVWFLVLVSGSLAGAIWYFIWKRRVASTESQTA